MRATRTPQVFIIAADGTLLYSGAVDNAPFGKVPGGEKRVDYVSRVLTQLALGQTVTPTTTTAYGCWVKYSK